MTRIFMFFVLGWLFIKFPTFFSDIFVYAIFGWLVYKIFGLFRR